MSGSTTPAAVIGRLPIAWRSSSWRELDGGLSNTTWLLDNGESRAVLKFDRAPRGAPYNSRIEEARLQAVAAASGLANRVLHVEEGLLLSEYLAGDVWSSGSLQDVGNLERLAAALRRLHALPTSGKLFDALGASRVYASRIAGDAEQVTKCLAIAENCGSTPISGNRGRTAVLCHNDLVAENILATPDLRFLDWEYACDNDPLFDLATIAEHHELDDGLVWHLLEAYFDDRTEERWYALEEQRRLYVALLWLWLKSRPDSSGVELGRAAGRLATIDS